MTRDHRHFPRGERAMMRTMTILGAGLIGLMHPTASYADPLDFMFSFSNVTANIGGTVTGEIFGLTDNTANQAATNVVVDSSPAGLGLPASPPPLTIFTGVQANSFSVMNGEITSASFDAFDSQHDFELFFDTPSSGFNGLLNMTDANTTGNNDGFAGVTYTAVVPAPLLATGPVAGSATLLATGLATLWPLRRRLRRRAASA